jgi:hypothetical protein
MKILYLGFNRDYINPVTPLFINVLKNIGDLHLIGPGFSESTQLDYDLIMNLDLNSFDFVITDSFVIQYQEIIIRKYPLTNSYMYGTSLDEYSKFAQLFNKKLFDYRGKKAIYFNLDYYNLSSDFLSKIYISGFYIIGWGSEFFNPINSLKVDFKKANDNWFKFTTNYPDRIISFPMFVDKSEFRFHPLDRRKYNITLPGTGYSEREKIKVDLKQTLKNLSNFEIQRKIWNLFYSLGSNQPSSLFLTLRRITFQKSIEDSKVSITTGSTLKYPVRKYFEIPSKRTVLLCDPCIGLRELGFIKNQHYLDLNECSIRDVSHLVINSLDELYSIASTAQDLVYNFHTTDARSYQLKASFSEILVDKFKKSMWRDGNFIID